ncbi:MAG TPA: Calx-beta domain-containing protein, partial [Pirellulaceae bacterium]|nr:Calx-beta domain-containing protein [Pirellulaceae bacterium]
MPFTVDYTVSNGTAASADGDFTATTGRLSFSGAAAETQVVTVATGVDSKVEPDETVLLTLTALNFNFLFFYTIPLIGNDRVEPGTGTILNDDTATLRVADATAVVEGAPLSFNVALTGEVQGGFDLRFGTADGTSGDAANAADNDYGSAPNGVFRFTGALNETHTFSVATTGDNKVEADEKLRFILQAVNPVIPTLDAADITISRGTATGTITNNDTATLSISDAGHAVEGLSLGFVVTLSNDVQGGLSIAYATSDITASAASLDYTAANASLQFAGTQGETRSISIPSIADNIVEGDERFRVTLGVLTPAIAQIDRADITVTRSVGEATIDNDDVFSVTIGNATTTEAGRSLTFPVTLGAGVQGGVAFDFSTADGTATAADGDYVARTGVLTFAGTPGETQNIVVTVNDDLRAEPDETLTTTIRNLRIGGAATTFTPQTATGTITNDDRAT